MEAITKNIIDSYQTKGAFIVHDCEMLREIFKAYGIDPKTSTDRKIFDLEAVGHFFQSGVTKLFYKLDITRNDHVLSLGEGSGATYRPMRLVFKVIEVSYNPEIS